MNRIAKPDVAPAQKKNSSDNSAISNKTKRLTPLLLDWFSQNARDLPWRRTRDFYAIWISEIMLQQTQVKTVIPYWQRWMRELPTVQSLTRVRLDKVLKLWEGLGYYTRARNLQRAAQVIAEKHGGHFPKNFNEVLALPGIGRYTAGAICSIGFNQPTPVLDGNVIRVLTRIFGIDENPREKKTNNRLWELAEELVIYASRIQKRDERNCSRLNQALMELGATICTPRQPRCLLCPVKKFCIARRYNRIDEIPNLDQRPRSTERRFIAFLIENRGRYLIRQRPIDVVNAHLWEFPNMEVINAQIDLRQLAKSLLGFRVVSLQPRGQLKHTITRYRITLDVFGATPAVQAEMTAANERWLSLAQLQKLAFTSAHRKIWQNFIRERR